MPKSYSFDQQQYPQFRFALGTHYGLVAQDVEQVLPSLIKEIRQPGERDTLGNLLNPDVDYKSVNYLEIVPFLIAAVNDAHTRIDSLVNILNGGTPRPLIPGNNNSQQRITLSNQQGVVLHQNDPNPFAESTIIRFSIPESVSNARLLFSDTKGTILKLAQIDSRGEGSLEVFASDLSSGLYMYTLVCDGKVVDLKKMVKQ